MRKPVCTTENIEAIAVRDGGMICHYCGIAVDTIENLTTESRPTKGGIIYSIPGKIADRIVQVDHKQPKSRGGSDDLDNLVLACTKCNQRKGAKSYKAFLSWLDCHDM